MITKIEAAELTVRSGTEVIIAAGWEPNVLLRLAAGENLGTRFRTSVTHVESRKRWILAEPPRGTVFIDSGAVDALVKNGRSLLAVGITDVTGSFERGQTVQLMSPNRQEVGRGVTNYNASDLDAIKGCQSDQIPTILGYQFGPTVVHRNDLVLV